jgi:hypothetical protein
VIGNARAGAGDAITHLDAGDLAADLDHLARGRVAGRQAGIELALDLLVDPGKALVLHQLQRLLDVMRLFQRTAIKRQARHLDAGHLGADGNTGRLDPNQNVPGPDGRRGNLLQEHIARTHQ